MANANDRQFQKDAADQNFDYMFKLLIIGNSAVGKTSFLFRYADDSFTSAFVSTVGIDFKVKTVFRNEKRVKLQIWDTGIEFQAFLGGDFYSRCLLRFYSFLFKLDRRDTVPSQRHIIEGQWDLFSCMISPTKSLSRQYRTGTSLVLVYFCPPGMFVCVLYSNVWASCSC